MTALTEAKVMAPGRLSFSALTKFSSISPIGYRWPRSALRMLFTSFLAIVFFGLLIVEYGFDMVTEVKRGDIRRRGTAPPDKRGGKCAHSAAPAVRAYRGAGARRLRQDARQIAT